MTDREILELILANQQETNKKLSHLENDVTELKTDVAELKTDVAILKIDVAELKDEVTILKLDVAWLKDVVRTINIHLENITDRNIQLLAENFLELNSKLNQSISVANNNLAYEVKVNYLTIEMEKLKNEVKEMKR